MASFGARLKEQRERRKISLDEISASTKISSRLLNALEEDHFELLPGGIFNKGFIRAYAQYLALDEEQMIAEYLEASGIGLADEKADSNLAAVAEIRAEAYNEESASLPWGLFAVILLIVALGFAAWGFYSRQTSNGGKSASVKPLSASSVPSDSSAPPPTAHNKLPPVKTSLEMARPAVTSVSTDGDSSARVIGGSSASVPPSGGLLLRISAREDSWVSITADGKRVLQDTLSASTEKSVQAAKEITVKAGNIGALDFEWNGKKLPPQGTDSAVVTLRFDPNGWHTVAKPTPAPAPEATSPN